MARGLFLTFEGCDGCGKTTVLNRVSVLLKEKGIPFLLTREPGGSKIAEEIRNVILDKKNTEMDPRCEALLYAASRRQHLVEIVLPALEKGIHVLSDRYLDSSLAYQGYARGIGMEEVYSINLFAIDGMLPDLTFFLDLPPEEGLARIRKVLVTTTEELNKARASEERKAKKAGIEQKENNIVLEDGLECILSAARSRKG